MNDIELLKYSGTTSSLYQPKYFSKTLLHLSEIPEICIINLFPFLYSATQLVFENRKLNTLNNILLNVRVIYTDNILLVFNTFGAAFSGFIMELCIEMGCNKFILLGSAGILQPQIQFGEIVIPDIIIRDEGTSFHYIPPTRTLRVNPESLNPLTSFLRKNHIQYHQGLHWTTDAPFRETPNKVDRLQNEGCLSVDMEASALAAIAEYHQKSFAAFLIGLDRLDSTGWSPPLNLPLKKVVTDHYRTLIHYIESESDL